MAVEPSLKSALTGGDHVPSSIAQNAFLTVKERLSQTQTVSGHQGALLSTSTGIHDVQQVIETAFNRYQDKHEASKTRKWLHAVSERIAHYGKVLDVFVQHHPEYVSLAWGTMKLLFVCVMNHEKTLKTLAKSLCQVADRLPRINNMATLFPTAAMERALELLYSNLLEFLLLAYDWSTQSAWRHALHSFIHPPELRYSDVLERISESSTSIMELATVSSQGEIRTMRESHGSKLDDISMSVLHIEKENRQYTEELRIVMSQSQQQQSARLEQLMILMQGSSSKMSEILTRLDAQQSLHSSAQLNTNLRLTEIQVSQAISTLSLSYTDPETCFRQHTLLRNRRLAGSGTKASTNQFWLSPKLPSWTSNPASSLVIVKGGFSTRFAMLDFGIDVIHKLASCSIPTIWVLTSAGGPTSRAEIPITTVLKYLTYQLLQIRGAVETEKHLSVQYSRFQTARDTEDWLQLFEQVLVSLQGTIYIVVDIATAFTGMGEESRSSLVEELGKVVGRLNESNATVTVKIMILAYAPEWQRLIPPAAARYTVPVKGGQPRRFQGKVIKQSVGRHMFRHRRVGV